MDELNARLPHPIYGYTEPENENEAMDTNDQANMSREEYKSADEGEGFEIVDGKPSPTIDDRTDFHHSGTTMTPISRQESSDAEARDRTFNTDPTNDETTVPESVDQIESPVQSPITHQKIIPQDSLQQSKLEESVILTKRPERQKTMVVSSTKASPLAMAVKEIFEKAKKNGDYEDAERAILASIANHEKLTTAAWSGKLEQVKNHLVRSETDREVYKMMHEGCMQLLRTHGLKGGNTTDNAKYEQLEREQKQLLNEHHQLYSMYQKSFEYIDQLKALNKDLKEANEEASKSEELLKGDIKAMAERYNRLLLHSKEKINQANDYVRKVEERAETDRLALATKQTSIASLEQQLETKSTENRELQSICNTLMEKLNSNDTDEGSEFSYQYN